MSLAAAPVTILDTVSKFNNHKTRWIGVLLSPQQGSFMNSFNCVFYFFTLLFLFGFNLGEDSNGDMN